MRSMTLGSGLFGALPFFLPRWDRFLFSFAGEGDGGGEGGDGGDGGEGGEGGAAAGGAAGDPEPGSDAWYEAEATKRGAKNILKENERIHSEVADLKKKVEEYEAKLRAGTDTSADSTEMIAAFEAYRATMKEEGWNDKQIDAQLKLMDAISTSTTKKAIGPHENALYEPDLDAAIESLMADNKTAFAISKLEKEFRKTMRDTIAPQFWKMPSVQQRVLGGLYLENRKLFTGKPGAKVETEEPAERGGTGGESAGAAVNEKAFQEFCDERGMNTATPTLKKAALEAYGAYQKMNKAKAESQKE